MSQVGVSPRPATQGGMGSRAGLNLPQIQHPLSRLGSPEKLDVRGVSRAGDRLATQNSGRALANEGSYMVPRKIYTSSGRDSQAGARKEPAPLQVYDSIPEGVEITVGPGRTKMPIFGSRAGMADRGDVMSRATSRLSQTGRQSAQLRLEIDELEMLLRQKVKGIFYELKMRFKSNDPEGQGNVSREALCRIIVTVINKPMKGNVFNRLMDRLGLGDKQVISFTEFFAVFRDIGSSEYPRWMDPIQRAEKITMTASQVHTQLKENAKQRFLDLADLIPQSNPGGAGKLLKPEFRNALNKMLFFMDEDEFEKLWKRYDPGGSGTIDGAKLLNKLGINISKSKSGKSPRLNPLGERVEKPGSPRKTPRKKEQERQQSLNVERWLKDKFREGCYNMRNAFENYDSKMSGMVTHDEFLKVLSEFGLSLEKSNLDMFLARCQAPIKREGVPYREFLHRFQDRSEGGMPHNILSNPKHRYNNDRAESVSNKSAISSLETQMMNMFQRDFLSLLGTFHKIDHYGTDLITQEEFRAAIESKFPLNFTDIQFSTFIDRVPLNEDGMVKYADFMAQFDTRGQAPSLFEGKPQPVITSPRRMSPVSEAVIDRLILDDEPLPIEEGFRRPAKELFILIKDLLNRRFQEVEIAFHELDDQNSNQMSQEMFYQLMKNFDLSPEISRGEIRDLWKTFIIQKNKALNFFEFVRHFGYSARSATFPNAKISPPKKGDCDFMIRSRKLNCAADMLQDGLRSKIEYMWEDLRREFVDMDPYGTGCVSSQEFREVLSELCINLSDYELDMLTRKFDLNSDLRVSYIAFLKPFAMKKAVWRHGNNMLSLLQHPEPSLPLADIVEPPQKGLTGITAKLRQKLAGEWKNLRRAFKKLDVNNEGYITLPEFRSVLNLAHVVLNEDEVYHVMSQFDEKMSGKLPYNQFLNETFKPA